LSIPKFQENFRNLCSLPSSITKAAFVSEGRFEFLVFIYDFGFA